MGVKVTTTVDAVAGMAALGRSAKRVVVIGQAANGDDNKLVDIYSLSQAKSIFSNGNLVDLLDMCFTNRVKRVSAVKITLSGSETPTEKADVYKAALDAILAESNIDYIVLDANDEAIVTIAKTHCLNATAENRPRKLITWGGTTEAEKANSGRVWVVDNNLLKEDGTDAPGMLVAAAVATVISLETDPALPVHSLTLKGFGGVKVKKTVAEMDALADAGVLTFEQVSGEIEIYRGATSYTKDSDGNPDKKYSDITTIEIIDTVVPGVQRYLQGLYRRAKNTDRTRDSIESDVKTALLEYEKLEYIEDVENSSNISATPVEDKPKATRVDYNFKVVHPLEEIQIYAHAII